jgi:cytochrome c-type biogenesis protein CcmE
MDAPPTQRRTLVRAALAVTALVVVGVGVYLVLDAFTVGSVTFRFVDEVAGHEAELQGKRLKISGGYVAASRTPTGPNRTSFALEKNGARLTVLADDGLLPNGFDVPGRDVVVDGMLDATGAFRATLVTTGCPSRYEAKRR